MVACSPCSPNYYTITITIMFQCYCLVIASTELCELVNIAQIMLFRWGLMTITTVGYDLSPKTFLGGHFDIFVFYMYWRDQSYIGIQQKSLTHPGKIIGGFCALSGVFILTLPIPIVVKSSISQRSKMQRSKVSFTGFKFPLWHYTSTLK